MVFKEEQHFPSEKDLQKPEINNVEGLIDRQKVGIRLSIRRRGKKFVTGAF